MDYHTFNFPPRAGIAEAGLDYQSEAGTLVYTGGTYQDVKVQLLTDTVTPEVDETFEFRLENPRHATIAVDRVTATIKDVP